MARLKIPCRIPYRPGWVLWAGTSLFCSGGYPMAQKAATNHRGLTLEGVFHLSPGEATVFYWIIFGVGTILAIFGLIVCLRSLLAPRYIELTETEMRAPISLLSNKIVTIPYSAITHLREMTFRGRPRGLLVLAPPKRLVSISRLLLPSIEVYELIKNFLLAKIQARLTSPSST